MNANQYGRAHADRYAAFLRARIQQLPTLHDCGIAVPLNPGYRYIVIRRKAKGHGHIAVYRVKGLSIEILHVFHTAQNWQTVLEGGSLQ